MEGSQCTGLGSIFPPTWNHKFRESIQARRAWRWATFIMHELCVVRMDNYDSVNCKQAMFGERIHKRYGKMIKIWHLLSRVSFFGSFGLSVVIKCLTMLIGMRPRSSTTYGMNSFLTPKRCGKEWSNKSRLVASLLRLCSKVLTILGVLERICVEGPIFISSGIGNGNVDRFSSPLAKVVLGVLGLSLVGSFSCFLRGVVLRSRGPAYPWCGWVFLVLNAFGIGFVGLLSQMQGKCAHHEGSWGPLDSKHRHIKITPTQPYHGQPPGPT